MTVEIETPRLLLRRWEHADLGGFTAMNADPQVMRYFPQPYSEARTLQLYDAIQKEFAEYGYGLYAAQEKSSDAFMGFIGFHWARFDADFCPCIEIGWRLGREFWNRGYATEGAKACLAHGFSRLGFERVYSFTSVTNLPSQRVMQKIGMRPYTSFEHPEVAAGHPLRPHVCYAIDKDDASLCGGKTG